MRNNPGGKIKPATSKGMVSPPKEWPKGLFTRGFENPWSAENFLPVPVGPGFNGRETKPFFLETKIEFFFGRETPKTNGFPPQVNSPGLGEPPFFPGNPQANPQGGVPEINPRKFCPAVKPPKKGLFSQGKFFPIRNPRIFVPGKRPIPNSGGPQKS